MTAPLRPDMTKLPVSLSWEFKARIYIEWLEQQLELCEAAREAAKQSTLEERVTALEADPGYIDNQFTKHDLLERVARLETELRCLRADLHSATANVPDVEPLPWGDSD